ncbi:MAG: hypothetical protein LBE85_11430 [Candidatus Accumulibacter sp.]|jgi:membrane protein YdbS with pleckstrin-like domain|nr:hypothetical protein [Accumulibacter sp.]
MSAVPAEVVKQIRLEIVISSALLLLHLLFQFQVGGAITQPLENLVFGVSGICLTVLLVMTIGWNVLLLVIHVRYVIEDEDPFPMGRMLAVWYHLITEH